MTNFEKYLFNLLWNSGEDCCTKCAYCSRTGYCDNFDDGVKDKAVCLKGMKEFFEKNG